jgi:hypothetical protein
VIALGLLLAITSTVAINGGYAWQHDAASALPPLTVRHPIRSLLSLFRNRRWFAGFAAGIGGWVLYVVALRIAPLSLVQAAAAGGIAMLAVGGGRLLPHERLGVVLALVGLVLLGLSLGAHTASSHGSPTAVALWLGCSAAAAALAAAVLPGGFGLGTAAGILYAAGDVGTKIAVVGGARLWFVPALLACHGLAFVAFQLALQRGRRLATAGVAVLWTNALPIAGGMVLFAESSGGALRLLAFALVLVAAVALARATEPAEPEPVRV